MTFDAAPVVIIGTHPRNPRIPGQALQDSALAAPCQTCAAPTGHRCAPECPAALRLLDYLHGQIAAVRRPCLVCGAGERERCLPNVISTLGQQDMMTDAGAVSLVIYESLVRGRYGDALTVETAAHVAGDIVSE